MHKSFKHPEENSAIYSQNIKLFHRLPILILQIAKLAIRIVNLYSPKQANSELTASLISRGGRPFFYFVHSLHSLFSVDAISVDGDCISL